MTAGLALLVGLSGTADAADGLVTLKRLPVISKEAAALPRVANTSAAGTLINADLEKRDQQLRKDIGDCRDQGGDWERDVAVAMRGPRYLSLVVTDSFYCGGPYASTEWQAIVYDLKTGKLVKWPALVPGVKEDCPGWFESAALSKLFFILFVKQATEKKIDPDCNQWLHEIDNLSFLLWPDAKHGALALLPADLPHVMLACADTVYAGDDEMRALGVPEGMRAAIKAAHEAQHATGQPGSSASR